MGAVCVLIGIGLPDISWHESNLGTGPLLIQN
jgi:hypothetical protein